MKNILKTIFTIFVLSFILSCSSNSDIQQQTVCNSSNTEFQQLYNQQNNNTNTNIISEDTPTHAYTFEVTNQKNICSIGYQSIPSMATIPYHIEIFNNTTGVLIYTVDSVFSSSATSYISVGSIPLLVGNSYTIKRIQNNWGSNILNTIGRILYNPNSYTFPLQFGDLKITSVQVDGGNVDTMIPYIDIVFE